MDELFNEAVRAHAQGNGKRAERLYRELLGRQPAHAGAWTNLGLLLADRGDWEGAIACHESSIRADARSASAHYNLGQALVSGRRWEDAAASYGRALTLNPRMEGAALGLSLTLMAMKRKSEALEVFGKALALPPENPAVRMAIYVNRGSLHYDVGLMDQAEADYRAALQLTPHLAMAWNNLAEVCFNTGRAKEGLAYNQKARELAPEEPFFWDNRMFRLQFLPGWGAEAIRNELAAWRGKFADPLKAEIRPHGNERSPERRLRVGYVSPNFRDHCQALFMVPLLAHHDPSQVEVFCYADVPAPDAMTARLRGLAHAWRDTAERSHAQLAELIRADRIDILVDLTMHMWGSRLPVFARKPAPVQVTWLAYPGSTGLDTIDYRLTDPHLDPPGGEGDGAFYAEKSIRLPATFWCYDPLEENPPPVGPLPALAHGYVTFGCLNNFCKVNEGVLNLWARVLTKVADSRLMLLADEGAHRERTWRKLENLGIARERVTFVAKRPRAEYLKQYQQIDMGLDTTPYNGHTTSLDSYFMGVPVVTLVGATVVGRAGLSQLTNLGMPELIGRTEAEFVAVAVRLAEDLDGLSKVRAGLRQRMRESPLMDAGAFARDGGGIPGDVAGVVRRWIGMRNARATGRLRWNRVFGSPL